MAKLRLVGEGPDDVAVFVALVKRFDLPLSDKGAEAPDKLVIIYHNLGIDPHAFIRDKADRPVPILPPNTAPIPELIA
jgi:hypothetical protein